jgi:hypothetical protein
MMIVRLKSISIWYHPYESEIIMDNLPHAANPSALEGNSRMKEKTFSIASDKAQNRTVSPVLIGMLILMVIFPFIANKLPTVLQTYLDAIHK